MTISPVEVTSLWVNTAPENTVNMNQMLMKYASTFLYRCSFKVSC